jgi:hypothetical protein
MIGCYEIALSISCAIPLTVPIGGKRTNLWRAVDDEGEVLEVLAQSRRSKPNRVSTFPPGRGMAQDNWRGEKLGRRGCKVAPPIVCLPLSVLGVLVLDR